MGSEMCIRDSSVPGLYDLIARLADRRQFAPFQPVELEKIARFWRWVLHILRGESHRSYLSFMIHEKLKRLARLYRNKPEF